MLKHPAISSLLISSLALVPLAGCSNLPGSGKAQGTVAGGAGGAIAGAAIGHKHPIVGALIGGALGICFAWLLATGIGHIHQSFVAQLHHMSLTPGSALLCLAIAGLIGIISSFLPALTAARTNILDSLRYAG